MATAKKKLAATPAPEKKTVKQRVQAAKAPTAEKAPASPEMDTLEDVASYVQRYLQDHGLYTPKGKIAAVKNILLQMDSKQLATELTRAQAEAWLKVFFK